MNTNTPLDAESHNCEDGGVDDGLGDNDLGVAGEVSECPGVLHLRPPSSQQHDTSQLHNKKYKNHLKNNFPKKYTLIQKQMKLILFSFRSKYLHTASPDFRIN